MADSSYTQTYAGNFQCPRYTQKGTQCKNTANFQDDQGITCKRHARAGFKKLPQDPDKESRKRQEVMRVEDSAIEAGRENRRRGLQGSVQCTQLRMMKRVLPPEGYFPVFVHAKSEHAFMGIGYSELSPMFLGPVMHHQPSLPYAANLENFHQANKVFPEETVKSEEGVLVQDVDGNTSRQYLVPSESFFETQRAMYSSITAYRHKHLFASNIDKKSLPLYSVWQARDGTMKYFNYLASRQFYCNLYERIAKQNEYYSELRQKLQGGGNLAIMGYDAHAFSSTSELQDQYLDSSAPFGHEMVLACLFLLKEEDYPWRKYKTEQF